MGNLAVEMRTDAYTGCRGIGHIAYDITMLSDFSQQIGTAADRRLNKQVKAQLEKQWIQMN